MLVEELSFDLVLVPEVIFDKYMLMKCSNLGPKSRLEIIKNTGHAANVQSPSQVNNLIKSFVLGQS